MRRAILQIVILVIFVFLTVFATVWFDDTKGEENAQVDKAKSMQWLADSFSKTSQIIDGIMGGPAATQVTTESAEVENISSEPWLDTYQDANQVETTSEFRGFLSNLFSKAPSYYIDTKIYSNGWRNVWSLFRAEMPLWCYMYG